VHDALDDELATWVGRQPVFFVATAPSGDDGHVNLSPKGYDSFRVLSPRRVAYLDLTGSGVETIAHLRQNARITIMFCAFDGKPRIVRLHGRGTVRRPGEAGFDELAALFPPLPGVRSVIDVDVTRVSSSCGYAVPRMDLVDERDRLIDWAERRGPDGVAAYQADRNAVSVDGLPALG
jgi:hypothetical protein